MASDRTACALPVPCRMSPTSRPVNTPSIGFGDGAQRAGQPEPLGDRRGQLVRRRGDQPHLLAGVEVHLGQRAGARPDLVGDDLVVDVLAERHQLGRRAALDEGQRLAPAGGDVVAVLPAGQLKLGLRVGESAQVAVGEVLAGGQAAGEVHQRRAVHQRVVDVEERRRGQIGRRGGRAWLARPGVR